MKFRGETSRLFEIKTGIRQVDGISPLLFNCVLEKVIREWRKSLEENQINGEVKLRYKRDNPLIDCLAFADDTVILTNAM